MFFSEFDIIMAISKNIEFFARKDNKNMQINKTMEQLFISDFQCFLSTLIYDYISIDYNLIKL